MNQANTSPQTPQDSLSPLPEGPGREGSLYLSLIITLERAAYYGFRGAFIMYMMRDLAMDDSAAFGLYGLMFTLISISPMVGAWCSDILLGKRETLLAGVILAAAGIFAVAVPDEIMLKVGMVLVVIGSGMTRVSYTQLFVATFHPQPEKSSFTLSAWYILVSIGAFVGPMILGDRMGIEDYRYYIILSGVLMLVALGMVILALQNRSFPKENLHHKWMPNSPQSLRYMGYGLILLFGIAFYSYILDNEKTFGESPNGIGKYDIAIGIYSITIALAVLLTARKSMIATFWLALLVPVQALFWGGLEIAGGNMSMMIRGVGMEYNEMYRLNPILVIVFCAGLGLLWWFRPLFNTAKGSWLKIVTGLFLLTLSLLMLDAMVRGSIGVNKFFLILVIGIQALAEVLLVVTILAEVAKYAPKGSKGLWFASIFGSGMLANWVLQGGQDMYMQEEPNMNVVWVFLGATAVMGLIGYYLFYANKEKTREVE